ncbi:hypothetical protein ACQP3J_28245, partial [Escherichia coli]
HGLQTDSRGSRSLKQRPAGLLLIKFRARSLHVETTVVDQLVTLFFFFRLANPKLGEEDLSETKQKQTNKQTNKKTTTLQVCAFIPNSQRQYFKVKPWLSDSTFSALLDSFLC